MKMSRIVGTPSAPADPADGRRSRPTTLVQRAAASSGCATPLIALEELSGARPADAVVADELGLPHERARARAPALGPRRAALPVRPRHARAARRRRRAGGRSSRARRDIVYESYFHAPRIHALGPGARQPRRSGSRCAGRSAGWPALGIEPSRLGLILGFHSKPGTSGREGLQPRDAWLQFVKLNALAARQVATELGLGSIWSWGWGTFDAAGADPDKPLAACAYLWARDQTLCDAPCARPLRHLARPRTAAAARRDPLRVPGRDGLRGRRSRGSRRSPAATGRR